MPLSDLSGSGSELSSRHIPHMDTLSSTSFSFQIPGPATGDNLLADEVEKDFFRNAGGEDVSLALTHASPFLPAHTSPARIVERKDPIFKEFHLRKVGPSTPGRFGDQSSLSPGLAVDNMDNMNHKLSNQRPKLSLNIRPVVQAVQTTPMTPFALPTHELPTNTVIDQNECNLPLPEPKHNAVLQVPDVPETKSRLTKKKVDLKAKEQQGGNKGLLRNQTQRKVVEGGITKSRLATTKKTRVVASSTLPVPLGSNQLSAPSFPERPPPTEDPATQADSSSSSILAMTGIAGRLIQYGQKYIDPFRQIDTIVPRDKLTVNLDCPPDSTTQGPSTIQKTTQEREGKHDDNKYPMKGIADSLIQYRKKDTKALPGQIRTDALTEKVSLVFDHQLRPVNQRASIVQEIQEQKVSNDDIEDDRSRPLTLSQLSPRKQRTEVNDKLPTPITTSGTDLPPPSPMRPATKRSIAESVPEEPRLKKSKDDKPKTKERPMKPTVSKGKPNSKPRVQSGFSNPQSRKPSRTLLGSGSSSSLKKSDSSVVSKPAGIRRTKSRIVSSGKQGTVFNPGQGWNDNVRLSDERDMQRSNSSLKLSGSSLQNSRIQNEGRQNEKALIPSSSLKYNDAPQPTEESDSRSISRSHSNSQSHKPKFYHPAPNFKAIHAALDASLAQRKENVHPTVPLPMHWETDYRMQQRKRFEEQVREKEKEKEKEEEVRRRLREVEEERELKDLRKKMVVKAHEVPEWYNERPKTKKRQEQDVED